MATAAATGRRCALLRRSRRLEEVGSRCGVGRSWGSSAALSEEGTGGMAGGSAHAWLSGEVGRAELPRRVQRPQAAPEPPVPLRARLRLPPLPAVPSAPSAPPRARRCRGTGPAPRPFLRSHWPRRGPRARSRGRRGAAGTGWGRAAPSPPPSGGPGRRRREGRGARGVLSAAPHKAGGGPERRAALLRQVSQHRRPRVAVAEGVVGAAEQDLFVLCAERALRELCRVPPRRCGV